MYLIRVNFLWSSGYTEASGNRYGHCGSKAIDARAILLIASTSDLMALRRDGLISMTLSRGSFLRKKKNEKNIKHEKIEKRCEGRPIASIHAS